MKKGVLMLLLAFLMGVVQAQKKDDFIIDPLKSSVKWAGKKIVGGETEGTIGIKQGSLQVSNNKLVAGDILLDTKSIQSKTASSKLIDHLKNEDFFDVEKYPSAGFVMTGLNGNTLSGKITIKGITKTISFPVKISYAKDLVLLEAASVKVDRTQFGVQYSSGSFISGLGDRAIDDTIVLQIALQAVKK